MQKLELIRALLGMPAEEWRFWAKVRVAGECWEWQGARFSNGYGAFTYRGRVCAAHRLALMFTTGEVLPDSVVVMHRCDNRRCVNPEHLSPGSHAENMKDMKAKGRTSKGGVVLSADERRQMRELSAAGVTYPELQARYGVSLRTVQRIIAEAEKGGVV